MIVAKRRAGGDQVGDQISVTNGRGDFQCPFGVDELDVGHAPFFEEPAGCVGEFGGDTEGTAVLLPFPGPGSHIRHRPRRFLFRHGQIERAGGKA